MNDLKRLAEIQKRHEYVESTYNLKGEVIGTLDCGQAKMIFKGDADKSAQIFFDSVIRCNSLHIAELQSQIAELTEKLNSCTGDYRCCNHQAAIKGDTE